MPDPNTELLAKIRQQFDEAPYPRIPLEKSPKENSAELYAHSLVTPYYFRNQKVISTEGTVILDAGCGSGYKSLALAEANPGAKIVGIDLSEESVKLARQRLLFHGFENTEFYALSLEELPTLGMEFNYINCDEVLYLLPNPTAGLQAMREVLKPQGIIRVNFHSSIQRYVYLGGQKFFKMVGLMDNLTQEMQVEAVREVMHALKNSTYIKRTGWSNAFETQDEAVLANYLLQGDKGWTIPEFFAALREASLEFIGMVNWRQWDLLNLFEDINDLPISVTMALAEKSIEEQLHIVELLHPVQRLLDLWCGHPDQDESHTPIADWPVEIWQQAHVHLHPVVNTSALRAELVDCVSQLRMFDISRYLRIAGDSVTIDSLMASCLLPLTEGSQSMDALVQRFKKLRPLNPVTLEPTPDSDAFELIRQLLMTLEELGYVLLES